MDRDQRKVFRLSGKLQHYAWGGNQFLPELLKASDSTTRPFAEYWMGAHDNSSSVLLVPPESEQKICPNRFAVDPHPVDYGLTETGGACTALLNELIRSNPDEFLGAYTAARFGHLPYLLKILDVKDMLSIQVHPSKKDAEQAFRNENKKGIPLNAPDRNYKDDNHKPELMVALSDFWLLHGFKPEEPLLRILQQTAELQFLKDIFQEGGYQGLYKAVMEMEPLKVNDCLQPLLDRIIPQYQGGKLSKDEEHFWAARAALTFNETGGIDRGIFSIYLFNLLNLHPGEAIFQDAGLPHAYLEGQNVEIMANSDNVLRGGLTPKHIDVSELLKHVRFEATNPRVIGGEPVTPFVSIFRTPAPDFELSRISLPKGETLSIVAGSVEIYFVMDGDLKVGEKAQPSFDRRTGNAFLAFDGAHLSLEAHKDSVLFRAAVPIKKL